MPIDTMEYETTPDILPQVPTEQGTVASMSPQSPAAPVLSPPKKNLVPLLLLIPIIGIVLVVLSKSASTGPVSVTPGAVQSGTPTPTGVAVSNRVLNAFATESAFLQYEATIDGLPKLIQGAVLQDATVLPPVLDLKLGF